MVMRLAKGVAALLTGQAQDGRTFSVDVYHIEIVLDTHKSIVTSCYLPTHLPTYLPAYLHTPLHTYIRTCTSHVFADVFCTWHLLGWGASAFGTQGSLARQLGSENLECRGAPTTQRHRSSRMTKPQIFNPVNRT